MKLTFLGTGTSFGIPVVGCGCAVCSSQDPRDRRTRHAALVSFDDGATVLVDTPPELRIQLLREGVERVDAVWFTHVHADHLHGIDDLRIFSMRGKHDIPAFASAETRSELEHRFNYIFDDAVRPLPGSSKPRVSLRTVTPGQTETLVGRDFLPLEVPHGSTRVLGFRVGDLGYITDAKRLPEDTFEALRGVKVLVLNALWWGNPHPSHFNVEEAVHVADRLGAERTYLTHLTHRVGHDDLARRLPDGVFPAFDGLSVEVPAHGRARESGSEEGSGGPPSEAARASRSHGEEGR